ncbi:glycosyltransferase [Thomasclavelia sp.]
MSKILFINSVCNGSTGTICKSLYKSAEEAGHICCIAYGRGEAPEGFNTIKIGNKLDTYLHVLKSRLFDASGFGSKRATKQFIKKIDKFKPDIIHLHNIHGYYINIEILFKYLKEHPEIKKIWTLHDCWAFTGHCAHYLYIKCYKWCNECNKCAISSSYPKSFLDTSKRNYRKKRKLFIDVSNLKIVSVSDWLANQIKQSFLNSYEILTIKNGIDTKIFQCSNSKVYLYNDFSEKKIILGVANIWDEEKGLEDFIKLSKKITDDYIIILIGTLNNKYKKQCNKIYNIPNITNPKVLASWYCKAFVFFNPTKGETFGLTNYEAQACGTPTITYDAGGTRETIINKNSYVINNLDDFITILNRNQLSKLDEYMFDSNIFNNKNLIKKYIDIYSNS